MSGSEVIDLVSLGGSEGNVEAFEPGERIRDRWDLLGEQNQLATHWALTGEAEHAEPHERWPPRDSDDLTALNIRPSNALENHRISITLTLPIPPNAWPRPRFISWFNPYNKKFMRSVSKSPKHRQDTEYFQSCVKTFLRVQEGITPELFPVFPNYPVVLSITAHRPIAKKHFVNGKRENGLRSGRDSWILEAPTMVPDADNIGKFYMDALQGIAYADDKQVIKLSVTKAWHCDPPFTGMVCVQWRMATRFDLPHGYPGQCDMPYDLPVEFM